MYNGKSKGGKKSEASSSLALANLAANYATLGPRQIIFPPWKRKGTTVYSSHRIIYSDNQMRQYINTF